MIGKPLGPYEILAGDRLAVSRPQALFSMDGYVTERVVSGSRPYDVAARFARPTR